MGIKSKALGQDVHNRSVAYRLKKNSAEYKDRQRFVFDIAYCQVCGTSNDLDAPHHALDGISRKDDRTMVCICYKCHRTIHNKGFDSLPITEDDLVNIGWANNDEYLKGKL